MSHVLGSRRVSSMWAPVPEELVLCIMVQMRGVLKHADGHTLALLQETASMQSNLVRHVGVDQNTYSAELMTIVCTVLHSLQESENMVEAVFYPQLPPLSMRTHPLPFRTKFRLAGGGWNRTSALALESKLQQCMRVLSLCDRHAAAHTGVESLLLEWKAVSDDMLLCVQGLLAEPAPSLDPP